MKQYYSERNDLELESENQEENAKNNLIELLKDVPERKDKSEDEENCKARLFDYEESKQGKEKEMTME
jgi:hypothetical protein